MKTVLKITSIVIAAIILLFVVAGFILTKVMNPNDFKNQLANYVEKQTGRELVINGDIHLSFFPWLGVTIDRVQLSNSANFPKDSQFASVEEADITVKAIPLLTGKIEIGKIILDGLTVNLMKDASGNNNWQDMGKKETTTPSSEQAEPTSTTKHKSHAFSINAITVTNAKITYQDNQSHQKYVIEDVDIDSSNIAPNESFPVKINAILADATNAQKISIEAKSKIKYDSRKNVTINDLQIITTLDKAGNSIKTTLTGNIAIDSTNSTIAVDSLKLSGDVINLTSNHISGKNFLKNVSGDFTLSQLNIKKLLKFLDVNMETSDPRVLQSLSTKGNFTFTNDTLKADNLAFQLDDSKGQGDFSVTLADNTKIGFNINLDQINLDRYTSKEKTSSKTTSTSNTTAHTASASTNSTQTAPSKSSTSSNSKLAVDGNFAIDTLHVADKDLKNVTGHLVMQGNTIKLSPLRAYVLGGNLDSNITIIQTAVPSYSISIKLTGIQVSELTESKRLTGKANVTTQLTMRGNSKDQLISSLSGPLQFGLKDTVLQGINISCEIDRVTSFLQKKSSATTTDCSNNQTEFGSIDGNGNFNNGVFNNTSLNATSIEGTLTGNGTVNLVNQQVNYHLKLKPTKPLKISSEGLGVKIQQAEIPLLITGTYTKPIVTPDFQEISKTLIKNELKGQVNKLLEKAILPQKSVVPEEAVPAGQILNKILGN